MSELKVQQCRLDGRYDVRECLGRGSYAEVYLADDAGAEGGGGPRPVVIKALNTYLQGVPDEELERTLIENFRNEALALDRVRHPNVVSRLGHGTAIDLQGRTFHYLVLEYLAGGDMQALCRRRPLSLAQSLYYLEQIAAGLEHAHANEVIHRDVKPSNLLLTADHATVKLTDFGVAKIEAAEGAITRVGTDVYAAPEHHPLAHTGPLDPARATRRPQLTPAADVYSLAKTAYMLLTGEAPRRFSQKPITELPEEYAAEPWGSFVLRVLRRATATNPAERHQSVREFREELNDALLPHTRLLTRTGGGGGGETTANGSGGDAASGINRAGNTASAATPSAPPPPVFESSLTPTKAPAQAPPRSVFESGRPRIVVPVATPAQFGYPIAAAQTPPSEARYDSAEPRRRGDPSARPVSHARSDARAHRDNPAVAWQPTRGARRWLVALLLVGLFAGMLMATHYYVRGLRGGTTAARQPNRPARPAANRGIAAAVGSELVAVTDVNLRSNPASNSAKIGLVDHGARVRVLAVEGGWYEVEILERARTVANEGDAEQGWVWSGRGARETFRDAAAAR